MTRHLSLNTPGEKTALFEPCIHKCGHFTKTGSGQTWEKLIKSAVFVQPLRGAGKTTTHINIVSSCAIPFYSTKNDRFTKTGSGQTHRESTQQGEMIYVFSCLVLSCLVLSCLVLQLDDAEIDSWYTEEMCGKFENSTKKSTKKRKKGTKQLCFA
jgi:hypothetical protein